MAEKKQVYREKSLERMSSPEQLNDYLKVTKPMVWVVLIAAILLIVGFVIWGSFAYIGSFAKGTAQVKNGSMTVYFDDSSFAGNVQEGMNVTVGETSSTIRSTGYDRDGKIFAQADTTLDDGTYQASVNYKQTQVLSLLFGS